MTRGNQPRLRVELIPSPATLVRERSGFEKAELEQLVAQKVAEIMADRDAIVFEPFFRSRQVAYELKRLQSVPEQRKFSIGFERYGCVRCDTTERIHAGNGMCPTCHGLWFRRWSQIVAEGIKGEPARPGRGTPRAERLLPANGPRDGVHKTWYKTSNAEELASCHRVATRLGLTFDHVRSVARGISHSEAVLTALREDKERG